MKKMIFSFCMLLVITGVFGQAREATVENVAMKQAAAEIEVQYSPDITTSAINDYLTRKGRSKGNNVKGYTAYRNSTQATGDSVNADLYLKVARKSRSEKDISIITLLLNTPAEASTKPANVSYLNMDQAKSLLDDLNLAITAYALEKEIQEMTEAVSKAESKLKSLKNDAEDLEKNRARIENKIKENLSDQQKQLAEIEARKQKLAAVSTGLKN